ncbi:MAG: hypothetical protein JXD19_06290 [Deltaproteobacteria bacterium]|nr:hypothetical protein [Deltaproteobacteria bacterium]
MNSLPDLLHPRWQCLKHRIKDVRAREMLKPIILACLALGFWSGTFIVFYRVLAYFQGIESLGDFLAAKLLSMILLVFFSILLFSTIIACLSIYYLSDDLQLLFSLPVSLSDVYVAKLLETTVTSSWMVLLFGTPIFLAFGVVYHAPLMFYGYWVIVFVPLIITTSTLGVMFTMTLVTVFPARRTRDIMVLLSILFTVVLYILFRLLKPESLVDPESFSSMIDYFTTLRTVSSPFLPSVWASECLLPWLQPSYRGNSGFFLLMLWSTSLALLVIGDWTSSRLYYNGWSKSQEAKRTRLTRRKTFTYALELFTKPLSPAIRMLIEKDVKVFLRDTTQWSQLLLLFGLIIVYVYNFTVLPLDRSPLPTFYLQNLFSFLNLGLAGFVLSALAVRFVFPAVSLEGRAFWIIRTSPFPLRAFMWSKFCLYVFPLIVLAVILTVVTNWLLEATTFMMMLSVITILIMTVGITSLGVGMGAMYPRFRHDNTAEISAGFGGLVYMICAMALIGVSIILEARPVYIFFLSYLKKAPLSGWFYGELSAALLLLVGINIASVVLPIRYGLRNLISMENHE